MAIEKLGPAVSTGPVQGPKESFGKLLENAPRKVAPPDAASHPQTQVSLKTCPEQAVAGTSRVGGAQPSLHAAPVEAKQLAQAVEQVKSAQQQLDHILQLAESGRTFSSAELLSIQARVACASQQLDLAGKVVEKATSGIKQVLQTQV